MSETEYINHPDDIRLNENQELQALLGKPPGRLLHWGNTLIGFGMVVFFALGWIIKYPDVVSTTVVLTTPQPPIRVVAETSGKLNILNVIDQDEVVAGDVIAVLNNPADWEDVEILDAFLQELKSKEPGPEIVNLEIPRRLKLGGLQKVYADFEKSFDEYIFFVENNSRWKRVRNLENQIEEMESLERSLNNRMNTLKEVVVISEQEWQRNKQLKAIGDVSTSQVEATKAIYFRNRGQLQSLREEVINNNLLVEKTRMQIIEINQGFRNSRSSGLFAIQEDVAKIQSEVNDWKKQFMIIAPISGKVSMTQFQRSQQFINQNETLLTIVPKESEDGLLAKGFLPPRGSGKVEVGMPVNIRLSGYPYQEYGSIKASVKSISLIPQPEGFQVELLVDQPLVTTYRKVIPFQQEMNGTANIITKKRRILERIFDRVLSVVFND